MNRAQENPFIAGGPIKDSYLFFGRKRDLSLAFHSAMNGQCLAIVGERLSGKTSLLYQLKNNVQQARYLPIDHNLVFSYVNCLLVRSPGELCDEIFESLDQPDLSRRSQPDRSSDHLRTLRSFLRELTPQQRRLVLLLDEFENIADRFDPDFFLYFAGLVTQYNVSVITATMADIHERAGSGEGLRAFLDLLRTHFLETSFSEPEFKEFMQKMSEASGFPWHEFEEYILDLAGRFPFFVQYACSLYFDAWVKASERQGGDKTGVLPSSFSHAKIRELFADKVAYHFKYIWTHLDVDEHLAIVELASGQPATSSSVVDRVTRKGYVLDDRLFSSAFADFVLEQISGHGPSLAFLPARLRRGIWVDEDTGQVWREGQPLDEPLTNLEYRLLLLLFQNIDTVCDKRKIVRALWNDDYMIIDNPRIHKIVDRLRSKIEPDPGNPRYIVTVHGRGYKLSRS